MLAAPIIAAIGIGSNVGDRRAHIDAAAAALRALPQLSDLLLSDIIETAPVGPIAQDNYLNAAARFSTTYPPRELLAALHAIERSRARDRSKEQRWGPRTLDLDLLLYGNLILDDPGLTIPHPRLHQRAFVLTPLAQIAPTLIVPGINKTVAQLLATLG